MIVIELRCPQRYKARPGKLLGKIRVIETPLTPGGVIFEAVCSNCTRARRWQRPVRQVLHRFDVAGRVVQSVAVTE